MFDRIKAKEKAKTLLRTRGLLDAIGFGWILLAKNMGISLFVPAILSVTAGSIISLSVSSLINRFAASLGAGAFVPAISPVPIVTIILSFVAMLLASAVMGAAFLLFHAGMNRAALRLNRGDKNVRILDIALAGDRLGRYIAITLWQILFLFLWNLPSAAVVAIAIIVFFAGGGGSVAAAFTVVMIIAAYAWSVYITINKICQYFFAYCIAEDKRETAALDCVRESGRIMLDHKWELFVTMLSFIGWNIVGVFFVSELFVSPYKYLTYASIYEQLIGSFKPVSRSEMLWFHNGPVQQREEAASGERVIEILSGEFAGATISVKPGEDITIGRDPKRANIVTSPNNTSISKLHCRIRFDEHTGKYIVFDHSSNGTYLNNEKLVFEKGTFTSKGSLVKLADGAMILRLS